MLHIGMELPKNHYEKIILLLLILRKNVFWNLYIMNMRESSMKNLSTME